MFSKNNNIVFADTFKQTLQDNWLTVFNKHDQKYLVSLWQLMTMQLIKQPMINTLQ